MRKIKKDLIGLVKISLFCFAFFMLSPSIPVKAMFSDTVNQTLGIQLEFGTINLDPKETKIVDSVKFTEGESVKIATSILVNKGSLSAKLAYKIDVTKEDESILTTDELKNMVISIDLGSTVNNVEATGTNLNSDSYTFVKNTSGSDVVIDPDSVGKVPVSISYKSSIPTKEEKVKIRVTFRLIQSNALDANDNLFSDTLTIENIVSLIPEVVEKESYWPAERTFINAVHGNYTYSLENMKMLFSETYETINSETKKIKNLNKAMLYIQLPESEPLTKIITKNNGTKETKEMFIVSKLTTNEAAIKVESIELNEEHHGIIITFKLEDEYVYNPSNPDTSLAQSNKDRYAISLNIEIQKYGMYGSNEYHYYDNSHNYDHFFATRLVLNTDIPDAPKNYAQLSINLTDNERVLSIKHLYYNSAPYVRPEDFKEVQLKNEIVNVEITGKNGKLVSSKVNTDKTFSLWLNSSEKMDEATLHVKITGDTGNTLVISRKLEVQKDTSMLRKSSLNEERLVEDVITQSSIEESEEGSATEVESSTLTVEETAKEVVEEPVNESQEVDEADDLSSSETIIEVKENVPEVTKEDKEIITGKVSE
ncbi:hypothetical protein CAR_c15960 [Carnobacterium sp. 17-4]|uniref:hypothetical protein n=1 Tax=Carnobacterium sp. (strain 17-4) TaxID=208596 RepID=UPI0002058F96|nr:hypothetical protein [Carnobacterium sp. 17-4]AEB30254.1 hypothetical protein CAR_c15960 [Carnobacterium sp. 17-4]